ncbi:hypothetical protein M758_5G150900 [Ceratodon purpureus]|nr:hypothetical protein M758_5G150900 [Ceratodon purpureus]
MRGPFDMSNAGEGDGSEAIKLTSTLKSGPDGGGAAEVLQAVLNSSNDSSEGSTPIDLPDKEAPVADGDSETSAAASPGERVGWWNVLESATLQQNTEEFYSRKQRSFSPRERWIRLEKKAAKVGRGLSKDEKALKLGLQHWLEAIDPKHRYGHNLGFYYEVWIKSQTHEPFYYWLDIGEGKEVKLEQCSRSKLESELIEYLSPAEREAYEVIIEDGKLLYKVTHKPVHTPKGDRWIFVMSPCGKFYVAKKKKGKFQHSSFLAGGVTTAAGRLLVNHGVLELMEAHSGHYLPTPENFRALISTLTNSGADLTIAKVHLESEDEVAKRAPGTNGDVAPANSDNEMAFVALLASAGFTIRSDTNARFSKSDSGSGREDSFDSGSVNEEDEDYDLVLRVEKNSGLDETKV